jgi:ATP-dependent Clp protease ATP-binding subunit ClpX
MFEIPSEANVAKVIIDRPQIADKVAPLIEYKTEESSSSTTKRTTKRTKAAQ